MSKAINIFLSLKMAFKIRIALNKIDTLLVKVLIKSNNVSYKVEYIKELQIEEVYVKMSELRNVYYMVEDNKGKFFMSKSDKNTINKNIYDDDILFF